MVKDFQSSSEFKIMLVNSKSQIKNSFNPLLSLSVIRKRLEDTLAQFSFQSSSEFKSGSQSLLMFLISISFNPLLSLRKNFALRKPSF